MKAELRNRVFFGAATGGFVAISTLAINAVEGSSARGMIALMIPGLVGSAMLSGNIHAFQLASAAAINAIVYFAGCWLIYPWLARLGRILSNWGLPDRR